MWVMVILGVGVCCLVISECDPGKVVNDDITPYKHKVG